MRPREAEWLFLGQSYQKELGLAKYIPHGIQILSHPLCLLETSSPQHWTLPLWSTSPENVGVRAKQVQAVLQVLRRQKAVHRTGICSCVCLSFFLLTFCCYSVTQSCLILCDHMDCSTPGFPVHHQLLELTQTHVQRVGDAIQPSHPLSSPSPPAFNLSQHQGLLQWVGCSYEVAKVLDISFGISPSSECPGLISFRMDWFDLPAVQRTVVFSSTTIQKHRFFSTLSSLWPNSHICTWLLEKP